MRMKNNTPCLFKEGRPFFAGIRTRNPNIELERKGSKNVELEMTIPYASESIVINGVPEPVSDLDIHLFFKSNHTSHCSGSMTTSNCNIKLRSFSYNERHKYENGEWKKSITFQVFNQDTDNYVINSQWTLQTRTGITKGIGSKIFEDVSLPDISLRSLETNEEWKGKFCSVRADPHMYTFDGKSYECHLPGDFNNYRNDPYLQWIQSRHHLCFPSNNFPMCVCAVAARAGRDVFVIDFCGANGAIKFELCDDNVLVVIKVNDKHYKIYFPTGTTLSVYITDWNGYYNIDLEINPSSLDFGNSYGLCGFFDGVIDNDVTRRDKTTTDSIELTYPNTFSNSWKVQASENLFSDSLIYLGLKSISNVLGSNCKCTDSGQTECSYRTFTPCNFDQGKRYECDKNQVQNRQDLDISRKPEKPDVEDQRVQDRQQEGLVTKKTEEQDVHKDQVQNQGQEGDLSSEPGEPDVDNPKERDVLINTLMTFVQTKEYATIVCLKAFQDSPEYNTCQKHVPDVVNITIANCIEDVKMTGDESLIQMHVEAALQQCSMFVFLNETFQESEPDITYSIQNLCPSNCSSHGTCEGGNCTCDAGFGGSDCSFDFLGPPTITSVPSAGLCDLSTTTCKEATILGKYFFENMDSICYINVHQVDVNQSTLRRESTKNTLKERTLFEGYCPIPFNTTGIWTTEINFKISNDKLRFTDTYQIFIYQSTCQEYHNDSGNVFFTLKSAFCYIDGTCVNPMEKSMMNKCLYCNALNDKFNWTENEYCSHTTHSAIDDGTPSSTTYVELESTILMEELTKRYPQYHRSIIGTPGKSGDDEEESEAPELDTDFFFLFFLFVSNFLPFILLIIFICLFKHRKRPPQRPQ
ncbi:von Willebrand factor D and EGF domain-containing protein-like [Saccostrea echinata]|uniref:von Willebrand factor D and EGF domain-containing protein-like n=1 Tax=Saccostrea echinata TaxID=191078 RepID=UPI002A82E944|nr:von Willebrand factor D and EGF domain-containing protein-like [Saccostrea echinata]